MAVSGITACGAGGTEDEPHLYHLPPQRQSDPLFGEGEEAGVVVSLSFDDGFASQQAFLDMLEEEHVDTVFASFYLNSSRLNLEINERESRDHIKYAPLDLWFEAARRGHEIGSHSISHLDLSCDQERFEQDLCQPGHEPIDLEETRRQVCGDREMLLSLGFDVTGFAYPFGRDAFASGDETLHDLVRSCGFSYARDVSGLARGAETDSTDPLAESLPPDYGYAIRSYDSLTEDVRFKDVERWIMDARSAGGGWVPLVLHHVSDDCVDPEDPESQLGVCMLTGELRRLVRWLGRVDPDEAAPEDVVTRTMGQVVKEVGTVVSHPLANGTMEDRHSGSIDRPNCFDRFQGLHEENFEWSSAELEAERVAADEWGDPTGARGHFEKLIPTESHPTPVVQMTTRDDRCYLSVTPGASYQIRLRARARASGNAEVEGRFVVRSLSVQETSHGVDPTWSDWNFDNEPTQGLSDTWQVQHLNLPPIPEGVVALAFGYQYLAPTPSEDEDFEIWLDDFELHEFVK